MASSLPRLPAPWHAETPSLMVRQDSIAKAVSSTKVAGFDLNDTLVTSRIGAPGYSVTIADWQFYNAEVSGKLLQLHADGFKIVVFTNQGNVRSALDGRRAQALRAYIDAFCAAAGVPILVLAATQRDAYRKPSRGMWDCFTDRFNGGIAVDISSSFYVGDAAGEPGDHSADDLDFAAQTGLRFVHVRDFFGTPGLGGGGRGSTVAGGPSCAPGSSGSGAIGGLGNRPASGSPAMVPPKPGGIIGQLLQKGRQDVEDGNRPAKQPRIGASAMGLSACEECGSPQWRFESTRTSPTKPPPSVVLVLVGLPGCGKTTFAEQLGPPAPRVGARAAKLRGQPDAMESQLPWRRVCQDLLKTKEACLRSAEYCLEAGLSVVIDRTNVDAEQRRSWCELGRRHGAPLHCLAFDVSIEECIRRVAQRRGHEGGLAGPYGRVVIQKLGSALEPVLASEGFQRVSVLRTADDCKQELERYALADGRSSTSAQAAPCAPVDTVPNHQEHADTTPAATPSETSPVDTLTALGFSADACREALRAANGDANLAANRLLGDRLFGDV